MCACVSMFTQVAEFPQQETGPDAKLTLEQHSNLIESMGLTGESDHTISLRESVLVCHGRK